MFSKATEYALRAVIYIAEKGSEENKIGVGEISKAIDSPRSFTAKVLQQLTANGIVSSATGPNGGFYLSKAAKKKPVINILRVTGEDKTLNKCILGLKECSEKNPCPMHSEYKLIKPQIIHLFEGKTINELANMKPPFTDF